MFLPILFKKTIMEGIMLFLSTELTVYLQIHFNFAISQLRFYID